METQQTNKKDRGKIEAAQMKILRKLMKSQAIITKESNDDFRARLNINTIESETTKRRVARIARAAQQQDRNEQLKLALIGTHTQGRVDET